MDKVINKIGNKLNEMGNKICEKIEPKEITVYKYKPFFYTKDDRKHEGATCDWCIVDRLNHSVPRELMSYIREDGYIEDRDGVMYLLSNVTRIEWYKTDIKVIKDIFYKCEIFLSDKEVEKATI